MLAAMRPSTFLVAALAASLAIACTAPAPAALPGPGPAPASATPPAAPTPAATKLPEPVAPAPVEPVASRPVASRPVDDCGLRATIAEARGRDGAKKYTLTLKNAGTTARTLVVPGDGSEYGRRTPMLAWSATRDGAPAAEVERPGCGMMNAIEASEIFTLEPGASRAMSAWILGPSLAPGRYEVTLRYTNDPGDPGAGNTSPEVAALLAKTTACDVTSAPLSIQVP